MSLDKSNDQRLRDLQIKIRARSDSELLNILNDKPENWTPEALAVATSEVESRGGVTELQIRIRKELEHKEQAQQRQAAQERERMEREEREQARQAHERQTQQTPLVTPHPSSAPQPQAPQQGGGLDFRTLAKFIGALGVAVICFGVFQVLQNQPLSAPAGDSGEFKGWGDFVSKTTDPTKNIFGVAVSNQHRAYARAGAYKVIGVGALIAFVAFAIDRSAKRPQR